MKTIFKLTVILLLGSLGTVGLAQTPSENQKKPIHKDMLTIRANSRDLGEVRRSNNFQRTDRKPNAFKAKRSLQERRDLRLKKLQQLKQKNNNTKLKRQEMIQRRQQMIQRRRALRR